MVICIDSHVFIWGIKKKPSPDQMAMVERTEKFFEWADKNNVQVIIPSIVIAEVLIPEPIDTHVKYLELIYETFIVANFDERAALKYAEIAGGRWEDIKALSADSGIRREKMKLDHMIIACRIVNGATAIYSTDPDVIKFGKGLIDVKEIPNFPTQASLF